jgi:hypothetical protein
MRALVRRGALPLVFALVAAPLAWPPVSAVPTWVSPPVTLASGDPGPEDPQVTVDAAGNATAVWLQTSDTTSSLQFSTHPVGGSWSPASDVFAPGDVSSPFDVATNAAGLTVAVWSQLVEGHDVVHAAVRPAGATWSAPVPLSDPEDDSIYPKVALDAAGNAVVTSVQGETAAATLRSVTRSTDGSWSSVDDVSSTTDGIAQTEYDLAISPSGLAIAAWELYDESAVRRVIQEATRPVGGPFEAADTISSSAVDTWDPRVAISSAGVATVAWREEPPPTGTVLKSRTREATGTWSAVQDLSEADGSNQRQRLVVDTAGTTTAVWTKALGPSIRLVYATRPAGGAWSAPADVTPPGAGFADPDLAIDSGDRMIVVFVAFGSGGDDIAARTRAPGGAWSDFGGVSEIPDGGSARNPKVAMDAAGQAVAAWEGVTDTDLVQVRGFDTQGPLTTGLTIPTAATIGQPVTFSWPAVDAWSPIGSIAWTFGDGSTASGASISKAYATSGTYAVAVTATDAVGNATTRTGTVVVAAPPVVLAKPALTGVKLTRKTIHVKGSDESPRSTRLKLTLSTAAKVVVKLKRTQKVKGKTVKTKLARSLVAGRSAIRLTSKIGGKKLPPGIYRITVRATNAAGASTTKTVKLKILS